MIDYKLLVGMIIDEREAPYRIEDTLLYALSLGFGADPTDVNQLRYVYEDGLEALPCMSLVLGYPGFWLKNPTYQVDWTKVLHAEEAFEIHVPLPSAGTVIGKTVITDVIDRGADKGAFIYSTKEVRNKQDGTLLASVKSATVARGDGGFNGPTGPRPAAIEVPTRVPDLVCDLPSLPQQALLYRLCGDMNPLHADPAVALKGGFERPILHGRATMGIAHHAIIKTCCDYRASRLKSMRLRFSAPFFPGETLRTSIWRDGNKAFFTAASVERGVMVLNNGLAIIE
ncbi:MAG: MaoC family dehydratase [Gammaproteobacteria bacterium]|nr:MaoC family dehydratase [Gammaproteobacteria bacterium]